MYLLNTGLSPWIVALLILILAILFIYVTGAIISRGAIVRSVPAQAAFVAADQLYYLPTASLVIRATAKVVITRNAETSAIREARLAEMVLDTTVQTVPDTDAPLALNYAASAFATDDLKFNIGASGLLEGINLTAEDRIANILTQVTDAPALILSGQQATAKASSAAFREAAPDGTAVTTETKEYTNTFYILTSELRQKAAARSWPINVDGTSDARTTVDASFSLTFTTSGAGTPAFSSLPAAGVEGLVTRPLKTVTMNIFKKGNAATPDAQYQVVLPDEARLVTIPVRRSAFVKKTYGFKLANGVLTENTINKPSEIEGFIGIPVAAAKALVSIPAQLLQFRLENIRRQTSLETEKQSLAKTLLDAKKSDATHDAELAKARMDAEKSVLAAQKEWISANKDIAAAKNDWEKTKKELEDLLAEIKKARAQA